MIYISGSEIIETKFIKIELKKIYGIGNKRSNNVCKKLGFSNNLKLKDLNDNQIFKLVTYFENIPYILSDDLKEYKQKKFQKLKNIKSYKGVRKMFGLPMRGQRTHTNRKTSRKFKVREY